MNRTGTVFVQFIGLIGSEVAVGAAGAVAVGMLRSVFTPFITVVASTVRFWLSAL